MVASLALSPSFSAPSTRATTLSDLVGRFESNEAADNPDVDVPLAKLRYAANDTVVVPGLYGSYAPTEWSRIQLSKIVGVTWDRFFANTSAAQRAEELNRRLARALGTVKVRTTKSETETGVLRAIVSESYSSVADSLISKALSDALVDVEGDAKIIRSDVTDKTTSYVVKIGEPYRIGGPGNVGDVWGGLLVRNSGVGFSRLLVTLFLHRLACKNGLVVSLPGSTIIRARHRGLDLDGLHEQIVAGLDGLPERLHRGARLLGESANTRIDNVELAARDLLVENRLPVRLLPSVMAAYAREPHPSTFGLVSAMTLAAQGQSPEVRYAMERASGLLLAAGA